MARIIPTICLLLLLFGAAGAGAADKPPPDKGGYELPARAVTHHTMTIAGRRLDYEAVAATLPIRNEAGAVSAKIFTIAYLVTGQPGPRPVSFVFNGGPGAASVFLHLGALGPRVLETPESGAVPRPPYRLVDNPSSWLPFTDLVFVDPVGTGFSRGEGKEKNPDKPFWDVRGDVTSLAAVVRLWLTRHQRWNAPVYLVGESYGGFRAAALAKALPRDAGVIVSGLVLVSPALDISALTGGQRDLLAAAFALPSYAATAAADKKPSGGEEGAPDIARVERFALSDYLVGLANMIGEPAPGDPFIARIARLIDLPVKVVRRHRGRISARVFAREIRRPEREVVSLYDGTVSRPATAEGSGGDAGDPVLDPAIAAYTAAFNAYAPEVLGYRTEAPYQALSSRVSREWNWKGARQGAGGLGLAMSSLQAVLLAHPATKLMIASGRYDLVTPFFAPHWLIDQLEIPAATRAAIRLRVYDGGHMMYMRPSSRAALARDAAALYHAGASAR